MLAINLFPSFLSHFYLGNIRQNEKERSVVAFISVFTNKDWHEIKGANTKKARWHRLVRKEQEKRVTLLTVTA